MDCVNKEVYFYEYCPKCKYWETHEKDEPCCDCLNTPFNSHSRKPIEFEDKDKK